MTTVHAFDAIKSPPNWEQASFVVVFGDELYLKRQIVDAIKLHAEKSGGLPATVIDGDQASWADVLDEVNTRSLFAADSRRFAIVEPAEQFVSSYRDRLVEQATKSLSQGCLVLVVSAWPANTRLYKAADGEALQVECRLPLKAGGKSIDDHRVRDWIIGWASRAHGLRLESSAAQELYETSSRSLGMIEQELAKLALLVESGKKVDLDLVRKFVGGWRQKTVWDIVDAGLDGNATEALAQLDHLIASGEAAISIFAQISFVLRRYAALADRIGRNSRIRHREPFESSAVACGFRDWPKGEIRAVEQRLARVGKTRGTALHRWLLESDIALKGSHASPERSRITLERLFLRLAGKTTA